MKVLILVLILFSSSAFSQDNLKQLVDSLKYIKEMPLLANDENWRCGDKLFWKVVQHRLKIVPFLIQKISDSTQTTTSVPYFGWNWTAGEIAYATLEEIIHGIPTFELLGVPFDNEGCGYCSYWQHLRKDFVNRKRFQQAVGKWYTDNRKNLTWVPVEKNLCLQSLLPGGYYQFRKE